MQHLYTDFAKLFLKCKKIFQKILIFLKTETRKRCCVLQPIMTSIIMQTVQKNRLQQQPL